MGGKKGVASAKQKAADKAKDEAAAAAQAREDADWAAAGEGKKSKAQAKRCAKDDERQEAQAKKLEARRLADEEAAEMAASAKKGAAASGTSKVTAFELKKQKEADNIAAQASAAQREQAQRRDVAEDEYAQAVEVHNENALDGIDARGVDAALSQLGLNEQQPKMKFSQYYERELPELKTQKPGLKVPQYKDMIWKKWQRAPENPLNHKKD